MREVVEHRLPLARLGRAGGGDQADREAVEAPRQVGEPAQRGEIGPVDVVHEHEQRPLLGKVGREPVQAVQRRAGVLLTAHAVQHRPRQRRRAGEVLFAHDRLEQLPHDRERKLALELGPARAQHAPVVRQRPRRPQQPRLADPGRPFDQQPATAAVEHPRHGGDLGVPLLELLHRPNICDGSGEGLGVSPMPRARRRGRVGGMHSIDPGAQIGHVHLKVAELDRAVAFYRDVLGFHVTGRVGDQLAFLAAGDYHHHIGLNTLESRGGAGPRRTTPASTTPRSATRPARRWARR